MASLYGVKEGVPLDHWPEDALLRLMHDLGRNGDTERYKETEEKISSILADRTRVGVHYSSDGELSHQGEYK